MDVGAVAVAASGIGEVERKAQKSYWEEHSKDLTVESMMLDSRAADLDKEERPELSSRTADWALDRRSFLRDPPPAPESSSSLPALISCSPPLLAGAPRLPLRLDSVLLGKDAPGSSSSSLQLPGLSPVGARFTSIPRRNGISWHAAAL